MKIIKKYCLFIFVFFISFSELISQPGKNDSLLSALKTEKTDEGKLNILMNLCKNSEGEFLLKYAKEALALAEKSGSKSGIAQSEAYLGKYFYFKESFSLSLEHLTIALRLANEIKNYQILAYVCKYIGYNHFLNEPKIAHEYYLKSITYSIMAKDKMQESYAYSAIGNLYESGEDAKSALVYYLKSLAIREKEGNPDELVSSLIETARAYDRMKQYEKVQKLVQKAIKIAEEKGKDPQNLIYLYQMIGYNYADHLKDYKKALVYFLKSYELVKTQSSFHKNNIPSIKPVADMYLKLGEYQKSSEYFKLYFELTEANQKKLDKELYESQFILKKEVEKQKFLLKDSEILKQKMEIQRYENARNLFIAGSIILLALIFFLFRSSRLKQKLNILLEKTVKERTLELDTTNSHLQGEINERKLIEEKLIQSQLSLKEANNELEAFIYKAAHDLKGPLTSSRGLINLAMDAKNSDDVGQYIGMIKTSLDKLDNILLSLHEVAIIRQGNVLLKKIDIENNLKDIVNSFKGYNNFDRIKINIDSKLTRPFHTDKLLIQTIFRNIIENAIKYSRMNIETPYINIFIEEEGMYNVIRVKDNGIGISAEHHSKVFDVFFRATEMSKGTGLGLYIVKNAINKLEGKIEIATSKLHEGTTFNLFFPFKNEA